MHADVSALLFDPHCSWRHDVPDGRGCKLRPLCDHCLRPAAAHERYRLLRLDVSAGSAMGHTRGSQDRGASNNALYSPLRRHREPNHDLRVYASQSGSQHKAASCCTTPHKSTQAQAALQTRPISCEEGCKVLRAASMGGRGFIRAPHLSRKSMPFELGIADSTAPLAPGLRRPPTVRLRRPSALYRVRRSIMTAARFACGEAETSQFMYRSRSLPPKARAPMQVQT